MATLPSSLCRLCNLLLLCAFCTQAQALGLGELELGSYLGEALKANIVINDVQTPPDISCFVLKDFTEDAIQKRVNASLVNKNGQLSLNINTGAFITDPIVNIQVSYVCEPQFTREYVVLIDPAPIMSNQTLSTNTALTVDNTTPNATAQTDNSVKRTAKKVVAPVVNQVSTDQETVRLDTNNNEVVVQTFKKPVARSRNSSAQVKPQNTDEKLMAAYVGEQRDNQTNTANTAGNHQSNAQKAATSRPYLVISGGSSNGDAPYESAQPGLSLRLETEIDFARAEQNAALMTNEDAMDEVTMMTNRLAHLETQILSLQTINTQLKTKLDAAENDGFTLSESQLSFLRYVGYAALLVMLLLIATFVRRELIKRKLERDESIWFVNQAEPNIAEDTLTPASKASEVIFKSALLDDDASIEAPKPFGTANTSNNGYAVAEQEAGDVLDHAEVFIAHGRAGLAIQLLQNHLEDFPTESPNVWLRLLALLAAETSEADYDVAVSECNQFFNIKLPSYADALLDDDSSIEDYPHIVQRLEGVWGSQFAVSFLNDLIYNQQSQPREGFARNTFVELFFLRQIADILAKESVPEGIGGANVTDSRASVQKHVVPRNTSYFDDSAERFSADVKHPDDNHAENNNASFSSTNDDVYGGPDVEKSGIENTDLSELSPVEANDSFKLAALPIDVDQDVGYIFDAESPSAQVNANPSDDYAALFATDGLDTEEINVEGAPNSTVNQSQPAPVTDVDMLTFDMSGLENIGYNVADDGLFNTITPESNTAFANVDDSNLIEFDWLLTDADDNQSNDDVASETPKTTKSVKPKKP